MKAISIGEVLWDIVGTVEHLGGAPFNFAVHLQRLGHSLHFVSAVGADLRGRRALSRMQQMQVATRHVYQLQNHPTGTASVVLDGGGQPRFVINHPAAYDFLVLPEDEASHLRSLPPDLIYFGTLCQMSPQARRITVNLLEDCPHACRFYDVNLRADSYEPDLVRALMSHATVVKLNDEEVGTVASMFATPVISLEEFCRSFAAKFRWQAVCITRGAEGCVLLVDKTYVTSQGYTVPVTDTIGAGDAFAAAFAHGLFSTWHPRQIADFANRVGALVASRPGASPHWTLEEAATLQPRK